MRLDDRACRCRRRVGPRRTSRCRARSRADRAWRCRSRRRGSSAERTSTPRCERRSRRNGPPPARIANTTRSRRQALPAAGEPGEVGALHLPRVADRPAPPVGSSGGAGASASGWTNRTPPCRIDLGEERGVRVGLEQGRRSHRRAGEPLERPARGERAKAAARARAPAPRRPPSTRARARRARPPGSASIPRVGCSDSDGDVDPVAIERGDAAARGRRARAGRARTCPRASSAPLPRSAGGSARARSASRNAPGQRCWWTSNVVTADASCPSATRRTSGSRSGSGSPSPTNGATSRTRRRAALRPRARAGARGDRTPGRRARSSIETHARAELDLLREAARGERRHRHAVFEPFGLPGRDELERDGLRQQPCLGRERLHRDAELAERALGEAGALAEPVRRAR